MTIIEYEAGFTLYLGIQHQHLCQVQEDSKVCKGINGTYQLATTHMIVLGAYFQSIIEHAKMTQSIIHATHEGTKKVCHHGQFTKHACQGRYLSGRGSYGYYGRMVQGALHG